MEIQSKTVTVSSSTETERFAEALGRQLRGGETVELIGDIGAGKTTFVRGLARGIGSPDMVSSPTFTVSQVYDSPKLTLHHYDFYRLNDYEIISRELEEVLKDPHNVAVLEWAEQIHQVLTRDRVMIKIAVENENVRLLTCHFPPEFNYLETQK